MNQQRLCDSVMRGHRVRGAIYQFSAHGRTRTARNMQEVCWASIGQWDQNVHAMTISDTFTSSRSSEGFALQMKGPMCNGQPRTTTILFKCDREAEIGEIEVESKHFGCDYRVKYDTIHACRGASPRRTYIPPHHYRPTRKLPYTTSLPQTTKDYNHWRFNGTYNGTANCIDDAACLFGDFVLEIRSQNEDCTVVHGIADFGKEIDRWAFEKETCTGSYFNAKVARMDANHFKIGMLSLALGRGGKIARGMLNVFPYDKPGYLVILNKISN